MFKYTSSMPKKEIFGNSQQKCFLHSQKIVAGVYDSGTDDLQADFI